ncbi:MAG: glycosyltransferase [Candidatus Pacebacteria bacterium]|nr:glycosyltransferase [Candidatus Paceibacterota bacterium]
MISVITPCLNICKNGRLEYFEKMMSSIHNQSWADFEHIVIDGGSTDGTIKILKQYQRKGWINYFVSERDSGLYSAMNKGLLASRGNYIHIMNTDDFFLDLDYFKRSIKVLQTKKFDFTHANRIIKSRYEKPDYTKKGDEKVAFFKMPFRHQTMIIKKNVFDEVGIFDENYQIAADYKFVLQMLLAGKKGYYFPETVLCSLDGGVSSNREKCVQEVSRVIYETYGQQNRLMLNDCKAIYLKKISQKLHSKILTNIKNKKIIDSLEICYNQSNS